MEPGSSGMEPEGAGIKPGWIRDRTGTEAGWNRDGAGIEPGWSRKEPGRSGMAPCLECRHLLPVNTPSCIGCESPIAPQLQPQTNICVKGKVICQACGTGNLHHNHCVTCESKLPATQTLRLLPSITLGLIKSKHNILFSGKLKS
ncbi:double zinc ribbon and ankyrin repeat-containing protein 1-like isoform X1 [Strigops habroptila]|uniref:double zinc ribbon and ankyrin repeat-containing protein 1-like isoform X1 n=1 Tax=Strigops habroptila TaxID=2489341 RepID=UPI0011CFFFD0|nr:double zinc ribbon and ankyrin repeat-containing protein 1-like isoform X1 [Strigops habroptila]